MLPILEDADLCAATVLVSGSAEKAECIATDWESVDRAATYDESHAGEATASQNVHAGTTLRIVGTEGELLFEPAFYMETDLRIR